MATPDWLLNLPAPVVTPTPTTVLDDAFFRMLALVSMAPVKPSAQEEPGAIHPDGLDVTNLRRMALRWCARARRERSFDPMEVQGLEMALEHFSDEEFIDMTRGAVLLFFS